MRSLNLLVSLLFAFMATAYAAEFGTLEARKDRNATRSGGDSTKMACKQMQMLTSLTTLAANQTKLDELVAKGKLDTARVDEIKTKAADATTKLQTLSSNSTLTSECAAIRAKGQMKKQCGQMKRLQKMVNFANNATALDDFAAKRNLTSTQLDKFKQKVQNADTKLKALEANTTLTDLCKQMKQAKQPDGTSGTSGTTNAGAAASGAPQQVTSSGAAGVQDMLKTMPYVVGSMALGGVFLLL